MSGYTIRNLREGTDMAPQYGFSHIGQAIFPREELGAETTGLAFHVLRPGMRHGFGHRHEQAEEVAVVLSGSGRVKLDDEIRDLGALDAVRIAPEVMRAFEAGPDGMELLVFGPRHEGDGAMDPEFWPAG